MSEIGSKIAIMLAIRGMTQAELANKAGVRPATISELINGKSQNIYAETLYRISSTLGVTADYLLDPNRSGPPILRDDRANTIAGVMTTIENVGWEEAARRLRLADPDNLARNKHPNESTLFVICHKGMYFTSGVDPEVESDLFLEKNLPCSKEQAHAAISAIASMDTEGPPGIRAMHLLWIPSFIVASGGIGCFIWAAMRDEESYWLCSDTPYEFRGFEDNGEEWNSVAHF